MIIKSIKLENIRSYVEEEIKFPIGSVLLSGDIGSGKSTVLLAIDFALFGLQPGQLSGSDILRHGANRGSVELLFEIDGKEISIKRTLKRMKDSVTQDSGFITINNVKQQISPSELKSKVLELLGYPKELQRKAKSLIFRYTVYTPQEEMKAILTAKADERLSILRKIFGIDKYKRIAENCSELIKEIRSMRRALQASISDLEEKREKLNSFKKDIESLNKNEMTVKNKLNELNVKIENVKKDKLILNEKIKAQTILKEELTKSRAKLNANENEVARIENELENFAKRNSEIEKQLSEINIIKPSLTKDDIERKVSELENEREKVIREKSLLEDEIKKLTKIYEKGICDTCKQKVQNPKSFKENIENQKKMYQEIHKRGIEINKEIMQLKKKREEVETYERNLERKKYLEEQLQIIKDSYTEKEKIVKSLKTENVDLRRRIAELENSIDKTLDEKMKKIDEELEHLLNEKTLVEKELGKIEQEKSDIEKIIIDLEREIQKKEQEKERIEKINKFESWLGDFFVPLMMNIEKYAMVKIQQEFNSFFQNWFNLLIDDENLTVEIDEEFTPRIEQNGYETAYQNLSGGEKTSVALSYRLALNKVINMLVENIKTKDLIILDEPTDGFSSAQLERIRDVLNELNLKQMIIVSHEPKIDTFVDNVIKFYKENHISRVVY